MKKIQKHKKFTANLTKAKLFWDGLLDASVGK
jgi:hypothetical protein